MENGVENDGQSDIDELHDQLASEAPAETKTTAENAVVEEVADSDGVATTGYSPNKDFCEEILAIFLRRHANGVRSEFLRDLEPLGEPAQAQRIADRAAMPEDMQAAFASHGARVLCKYGLSRFVNDEAVLVGMGLAYFKSLSAARNDKEELLKKHGTASQPQAQEAKQA